MAKFVSTDSIYKWNDGEPYDEENPYYDHFIPEFTGTFSIVDCLIVDQYGNIHPDYCKGVPIFTDDLVKVSKLPSI